LTFEICLDFNILDLNVQPTEGVCLYAGRLLRGSAYTREYIVQIQFFAFIFVLLELALHQADVNVVQSDPSTSSAVIHFSAFRLAALQKCQMVQWCAFQNVELENEEFLWHISIHILV